MENELIVCPNCCAAFRGFIICPTCGTLIKKYSINYLKSNKL